MYSVRELYVVRLPVYNIACCDNNAATRDGGRPKSESASKGIVMCAPPPPAPPLLSHCSLITCFSVDYFPGVTHWWRFAFSFHTPILVPPAECLSKLFSRFYWSEQPNDTPPPPTTNHQDSPSLKLRSTKCVFFLQHKTIISKSFELQMVKQIHSLCSIFVRVEE